METILVSACLLGEKTKYDGGDNYDPRIELIKEKYDIIPVCPEVLGGLKTPRSPSEIKNTYVYNKEGKDVTRFFDDGAIKVKIVGQYMRVKKAILMERSPSCGVHYIYNGYFNGKLNEGSGKTTQLLKETGIECYTLDEFFEKFIDENENQENN